MTDLNKFFVQISEDAKQMLDAHAAFLDKVSEKTADKTTVGCSDNLS